MDSSFSMDKARIHCQTREKDAEWGTRKLVKLVGKVQISRILDLFVSYFFVLKSCITIKEKEKII